MGTDEKSSLNTCMAIASRNCGEDRSVGPGRQWLSGRDRWLAQHNAATAKQTKFGLLEDGGNRKCCAAKASAAKDCQWYDPVVLLSCQQGRLDSKRRARRYWDIGKHSFHVVGHHGNRSIILRQTNNRGFDASAR